MEQQQLVQKYQQIQQQMQQVQEFVQQVEQNIEELRNSQKAAKNLKDEEVGSEILVPIGSGVYAKGELKDNSELMVNVGGDSFDSVGINEAVEVVEGRIEEMQETQNELNSTLQDLEKQMNEIQQQLEQMRKE